MSIIANPFSFQRDVVLCDNPYPLHCQEYLRYVPKKRLVFSGEWQNQAVIIKFYLNQKTARHYAQREQAGSQELFIAGIRTPALLLTDKVAETGEQVLVFEKLKGAEDFLDVWQSAEVTEKTQLLQQLISLTAQMHNQGLWQEDFHARNFLLYQTQLYAIDADLIKVSFRRRALNIKASLKNLAIFFAGLPNLNSALLQESLREYCRLRDWSYDAALQQLFATCLQKIAIKRQRKFAKKTLRECTAFKVQQTFYMRKAYQRELESEALQEFFADPDAYMQEHCVKVLKRGNSSTVILAQFAEKQYVIKRYNIKNYWHLLRRCLRNTRALHSWVSANCLQYSHINTATPIAFFEKRWGLFRKQAYFICEYIPGISAQDYFADEQYRDNWPALMALTVELFTQLNYFYLSHGDTKASNIIIHDDSAWLLDLDALQSHITTRSLMRAQFRDWLRFLLNWQTAAIKPE